MLSAPTLSRRPAVNPIGLWVHGPADKESFMGRYEMRGTDPNKGPMGFGRKHDSVDVEPRMVPTDR